MRKLHGVTLLAVSRRAQLISNPSADLTFLAGDILFIVGDIKKLNLVKALFGPPDQGGGGRGGRPIQLGSEEDHSHGLP